MFDLNKIRLDFPILQSKKDNPPLIYLDSAATSQKPKSVIDAIKDYYENSNSNIHRGIYDISEQSTRLYEEARSNVANFFSCLLEEIVFTKNATESINLVARSWGNSNLKKGDNIVLTLLEHHSNIVPWHLLQEERGFEIRFVDVDKNGILDLKDLDKKIDKNTKLLSVVHVNNSLGVINPIDKIIEIAKKKNVKVLVDGSQSAPHQKIDLSKMGADFFVFSGHKILAEMGIGVLFGKKEILENMKPFLGGGDMIKDVMQEKTIYQDSPARFEAGTSHVSGAVSLSKALEYLTEIGMDNVVKHERILTKYALSELSKIKNITIYGPQDLADRGGIISFTHDTWHPHDVAAHLNNYGICVRAGKHCTHPLFTRLSLRATIRASFYLYNSTTEIDELCERLKELK